MGAREADEICSLLYDRIRGSINRYLIMYSLLFFLL